MFGAASRPSAAKRRAAAGPRGLDRRIEAILERTAAGRGSWGIEVARLRDGKVLYARDAHQLFLPASNLKLFTTAAVLEKLGPDFVFHTTVESGARDGTGRVPSLVLNGRGDPTLASRFLPYQVEPRKRSPTETLAVFADLAAQVRAADIREVTGDIVADDSYFLFEPYSGDWSVEDLEWGYGAPVTALAFNDNELSVRVQAAAGVGEAAKVSIEPVPDYYTVMSRMRTFAAGIPKRISIFRDSGSKELHIWGGVPLGTDEEEDPISIDDPPRLAGELLKRSLEAQGVTVQGQVRVRHITQFDLSRGDDDPPPPPAQGAVRARHDSLPLREDIKVINKISQNLHAEMLLRTLAANGGRTGSLEGGREELQKFAAAAGIPADETNFADGSGLSRKNLIAPDAIVRLLEYMARSPRFAAYFDSLPVAGVDGTLADRFHRTPAEGRIHAKTGTLEHVNALSGYMDLPSGERLVFSVLGSSQPLGSKDGEEVVDQTALAILAWFARSGRSR